MSTTTESHLLLLKDLFHLSVSAYTEVCKFVSLQLNHCIFNTLHATCVALKMQLSV